MSRDMHRLQELVRLHRLKTGSREVARLLGMSPNTERAYRLAIADAGLLDGDPDALPELAELRARVLARWPEQAKPQHVSSAEPWRESIVRLLDDGLGPTAIHDRLRLELLRVPFVLPDKRRPEKLSVGELAEHLRGKTVAEIVSDAVEGAVCRSAVPRDRCQHVR